VGAVDESGVACEFSSRGKEIVVAAPGHNITSTWLADGYATISGTSMAAPFVSGVLALYISQQKAQGLPHNQVAVTQALVSTCTDVGIAGRDDVYGWGLVNPHGMMGQSVAVRTGGITIFIPGGKIL
jgi:subtilisin family serine protease